MKVTHKLKSIGVALVLGSITFACNQEGVNETNEVIDEAQVETSNEAVEVNRDYDEFEAWVQDQSSRAETATQEEWAETRAEFRRRQAELEAESANWDEATRQEWKELKTDWEQTENRVRERVGNIEDIDVDVDVDRQNN